MIANGGKMVAREKLRKRVRGNELDYGSDYYDDDDENFEDED